MFKDKLHELRTQKGITQGDLAEKLNLMPSTISMYEQGKRHPRHDILVQLADYFGVSVDFLLDIPDASRRQNNLEELSENLYSIFSNLEGKVFRGKNLTAKDVDQIMKMVLDGIQKGVQDQ